MPLHVEREKGYTILDNTIKRSMSDNNNDIPSGQKY
jgi:hypothetical protein